MSGFAAFEFIEAAAAIAAGAVLIWFPGRYRRREEKRRAARIAELTAGAEESYFEERRALGAYPLPSRDWVWRLFGALLVGAGVLVIFDLLS